MRAFKDNLRRLHRAALAGLLVAAGLAGGACLGDGSSSPSDVRLSEARAALTAVESCEDLESYITEVALAELDKGIGYYRDWVERGVEPPVATFDSEDGQSASTSAGGDPSAPPGAQPNDGQDASGPSSSDTNVQTTGVDEADLVKTDGDHIYVISGRRLRVLKSYPAEETQLLGAVELIGTPTELFLEGDTVLVYGHAWGSKAHGDDYGFDAPPSVSTPSSGASSGSSSTEPAPQPDAGGDTEGDAQDVDPTPDALDELRGEVLVLSLIDVSDPSAPKLTRTLLVEGGYVSARKIDSTAYAVVRGSLFLPGMHNVGYAMGGGMVTDVAVGTATATATEPTPADTPSGEAGSSEGGATDDGTDTATEAPAPGDEKPQHDAEPIDPADVVAEIEAQFRELLDEGSLEDWLPKYAVVVDGETVELASTTSCNSFYKPSVQLGLGVVSILAVDLATPDAPPEVTTTLGHVGTVYASQNAIYAAHYVHDYWFWADEDEREAGEFSMIHKFAVDDGVRYAASGKVAGEILNQFSIDEFDGHLRVATTTRNWATDGVSRNGVTILAEEGDTLARVGGIEDLALGEQIFSARFIGSRGYVVTFERIDPLFTLDLSDPSAPFVAGELKIPGFSTYIHPLGEDHLLTIGRDAEDNGNWVEIQGVQLQIFDVSDMTNPTVSHKQAFGSPGTESEALYEHKAFSYFADRGLLCLPFQHYGGFGGGGVAPGVPVEPAPDSEDGSSGSGGADADEPAPPPPECDGPDCDFGEDPHYQPPVPEFGVKVFAVDEVSGFDEIGTISHTDLLPQSDDPYYGYGWNARVRRTLLIEDALYTVGTVGVKVSDAEDLSEIASVAFPSEDLCGGWEWCSDYAKDEPDVSPPEIPADSTP